MGEPAQQIRVTETGYVSHPIRITTSYPTGIHKHHITVPIWPHKRAVKRSHWIRTLFVAAFIALAWCVFLAWAQYEIMVQKQEWRQADFAACEHDGVRGFCPYDYRKNR